jgi:RNA polymerase sigma-32 factor
MKFKIDSRIAKSLNQNDISSYLREINKYPLLAHEEEIKLASTWIKDKCFNAAHKLINSHLRLVVKISMKFRGYGLPLGELISEGNIGLIQSLNRFDPKRGFRLSTYAMWWIRASIQEFILHSWSLVKIGTTAAQKKLFFNLRSLKGKLKALEDGDLPPELVTEIAERLDVSENDVIDMNRRMAGHDQSLNNPFSAENDEEWINSLVDDNDSHENKFIYNQELFKRKEMLATALKDLDERERFIITQRRLVDDPLTLDQLSKNFGISRERVRQVEAKAFEKLKKYVKNIDYKARNFNQ